MHHALGHLLFNESPTATLVVDAEGAVVDLNVAAVRTLGRPRERLVGTPVLKWVVEEDRERGRDLFTSALAGRQGDSSFRIRRGDAVPRLHSVRATPVLRDRKAVAIVVFIRDVSDSRGGRPETLQLQSLLENTPGRFVVTLDERGRIRYASGLAKTHFLDDTTIVGSPFGDLLGGPGPDAAEAMLETVLSGDDWAGLHVHARADGSEFPARTFAVPHRQLPSGRVIGVLLTGIDVALEEETEARSQRLAHLEGLVPFVDEIATRVRHFVDDAGHVLDDSGAIRQIECARSHLAALRDFVAYPVVERKATDVLDLVDRVMVDGASDAEGMGVAVQRVIPTDPVRPADIDGGQVERSLRAMVQNGLDALDGVPSPVLRVEVVDREASLLLRVSDTGPGIPDGHAERIFAPLFTTRPERTGMGLALARATADAHGGRIWADRRDGWTVMTLELPREAPETRVAFRRTPIKVDRNKTVLVVEDDQSVRTVLRSFLEKVGYDVREAWSGRSAVAQLTGRRRPQLLITDLRMPDGSGDWFLAQLRDDFPGLLARTVILTGDPDHERARRLSLDTGCPLLRKPFDLPELLEVLDTLAAE